MLREEEVSKEVLYIYSSFYKVLVLSNKVKVYVTKYKFYVLLKLF